MGLCKCPKRRVTNQFCFEHRVNVCEHCMVTNHPKCVVQSYLQWLQDSDYSATCELCRESLDSEDCIRLTCYHVYHWPCIQSMARSLPANVAPGGYSCPQCGAPLFPQSNLVSPVADVLRSRLAAVNWGRAGLGLPLLAEERESKPIENRKIILNHSDNSSHPSASSGLSNGHLGNSPVPHSVVNVDHTFSSYQGSQSRRAGSRLSPVGGPSDQDEDKYKRRSPQEILSRWSRQLMRPSPRPMFKRPYLQMAFAFIVAFGLIIVVFSVLGHRATDGDPSFDVQRDPNVNIGNDI